MAKFWLTAGNSALAYFSITTALFFLMAGVALMVIMKLAGLMRRANKWHGHLVKLYYLYIPVICLLCGIGWAGVRSVDLAFTSACEQARQEIINSSVDRADALSKRIAERYPKHATVSLRDITTTICREYVDEYTADWNLQNIKGYSFFVAPVAEAVKGGLTVALTNIVEEKLIKQVSQVTRLEAETVSALWKMDIVEAMRGGLIYEIIIQQIRAQLTPMYGRVKTIFVLLMLPVLLETAVSTYFLRRSARRASAGTPLRA